MNTLTPVLLEHGLADEILLLVYPILLGTGTKAASSGVVSTYRPSGPLRTGSFDKAAT